MAKILIVDDDALVRDTVRLALERAKHDVVVASDGRQALELLETTPVDIVISDIIMPEVDGIGLILAMRKKYPDLRVICVSGGGRTRNMDFLRMAQTLGANMTLPKPFTPEQIRSAVETVLRAPPAESIKTE